MFGDFDFRLLKWFDEVKRRDGCLNEVVELMFVCKERRKEREKRSLESIYTGWVLTLGYTNFGL